MNDVINFPLTNVVVVPDLSPITLSKPSTTSPVIVRPFTVVTEMVAPRKFLLIKRTKGMLLFFSRLIERISFQIFFRRILFSQRTLKINTLLQASLTYG